jgi:hypothetical protein
MPIPVAAPSKVCVFSRLLAEIAGSNPTGAVGVSPVSLLCWQVEVSPRGQLLVRGSPTERGVSACVILKPREGARLVPLGLSSH